MCACMRACVRARGIARHGPVYVRACVRARASSLPRVCVRSEGGRRKRESCERAERLEPQIPFVRASSATAHDSTSSLPLSLLLFLLPLPLPLLLPLLLLRSSTHRSPHALRGPPVTSASSLDPRCDRISLARSPFLPRSFLLLAALPNPCPLAPPPLSPAVSLPLDRC